LSETYTVYVVIPDPLSVPDQLTGKLASTSGSSAATLLSGASTSSVFVHVCVWIAAFVSNTTLAVLLTAVPVVIVLTGITLNVTAPCPTMPFVSGGRNPTVGSVGGKFVVGSIVVKVNFSSPVVVSTLPEIRTEMVELNL
jgi:hypothetical protein